MQPTSKGIVVSKPRVAVVGTGYWGKNLVRNFDGLGALAAVCDSSAATLAKFTTDYPDCRGIASYDDILADSDIDAVAIATPAETHYDLADRALRAGKDVFVEKPLALLADHGEKLVALAEKSDRILMVGHLLWYHPAVLKLKELIDAGELGSLQYIYSNRLNLGKIRREENILWSFAPHDISVILGLLDDTPAHIQAQGGHYLHGDLILQSKNILQIPIIPVIVCLQKVLDRSCVKIREGFRFQIPCFDLLSNL